MFKKHFLKFTLVPLFILSILACYFRFVVHKDYLITFESDCDPYLEKCFVGCEDEECNEEYFYTLMTREATEVEDLCGVDITECDEVYSCPLNREVFCQVEYCSDITGECENLSEKDIVIDSITFDI